MKPLEIVLSQAESNQQRLAAVLRVVVFASLLIIVLSLRQHGDHHHPLLAATLSYGGLATAGAWFAWKRFYHRALPYVFATFEALLLALQVVLMSRITGVPANMTFAVPVAGLIFVVLAHAAMRYRPWLVVYTAGLCTMGILLCGSFIDAIYGSLAYEIKSWSAPSLLLHYQIFPIVTLVLTTFILFVTNLGTRRLLQRSLQSTLHIARLSRHFAPDIADYLASRPEEELAKGIRRPVAVLFVDIRGFSAIAERMNPEELGEFLGEFRERLAGSIQKYDGMVDKFIGDAVMAVFGNPARKGDDAKRALSCALDMIETIGRWSVERAEQGRPPVEIGVGVHFGEVFAGVIGDEKLLEFTVIGDTVNTAERLERLCRYLGASPVVSDDLFQKAGTGGRDGRWRHLPMAQLPGREKRVDVHFMPVGIGR